MSNSGRELVEKKLKEWDNSVTDIKSSVVRDFNGGAIFYVKFKSKEGGTIKDDFYYAVVQNDEVNFYDSGEEVIQVFYTLLERRRTFWQRLADFSLVDVVGAVIAITITITFVTDVIARGDLAQQTEIEKSLASIFAVIVGYYFGRVTSAASPK